MLRLTRAPNIAIASLWVDTLRQAGIDACLQRYFLGSAAGELPPDQCLPEVWLADHSQEARRARTAATPCNACRSGAGPAPAARSSKAASTVAGNCGRPMPA